jgi:anti-anti-sigma factor
MSGLHAAAFTLEFSAAGPAVQVAVVGGAVALYEARKLERGVLEGIRQGRTRVVLDLHGVTDVGPGLLGVLLHIRRRVTQVDGRLSMVVAGPPVSDLVRTTVLAALIDIAGDRDSALGLVAARNS